MAYREVTMWEVLEVLHRFGRGEGVRRVALATGHEKKTVRRYRDLAAELGWVAGLHEPSEGLALEVFKQLRTGPKEEASGETEQLLLGRKEWIAEKLRPCRDHEERRERERGLKLTKVHALLERSGVFVPYSSLHRFAVKHCGFGAKNVTVRVADGAPGEQAEVDFGAFGLVPDPVTGKRRTAHALLVTLGYSRHQYVHVTFSQKIPDLIAGLEDAFEFFGGVSSRVVIDNLKAAVTKADKYDPFFARSFEEYARYRGFVIDAADVESPTHKPRVERSVQYVRENFFRGEDWRDLEHVQRDARRWCLSVAGLRVHGTTRKRPLEVFEAEEKAALAPLEKERFDPPKWAECKVHPDHMICFGQALYSVPTRHIGKTATVSGDTKLVRIYVNGELIKTRPRLPPGGKDIDYNDYPKEKAAYAMRDPDRAIGEAKAHGADLGRFMERLLGGDFPWAKLRQAQALLALGRKFGWTRVDLACRRALVFDLVNVRRVRAIIDGALTEEETKPKAERDDNVVQLPLRFQRPVGSFTEKREKGDKK